MSLENYTPEQLEELALLTKTLAETPETRKEFLRLTKKVKPNMAIPELEVEETTARFAQTYEEKIAAMEAKLAEKDARENLEKRRNALKETGKANSQSDIEEIEKVMLEKGITNHEAAADYWKWMKQSAEPTPSAFGQNALKNFDPTPFMKNPRDAARTEAMKAFDELRKNPRPIGL